MSTANWPCKSQIANRKSQVASRKSYLLKCTAVVLLLAAPCLAAAAQQPKVLAPHLPLAPKLEKRFPWHKPSAGQSALGGLWITGPSMKSSLYLRSDLKTDPLTVTPVIYLSNGVRYPLPPVTLAPTGTAIVDIGQALEAQGVAWYAKLYGHVEIDYQWPWAVICAMVKNVDVVNSLVFTSYLQQPADKFATNHSSANPQPGSNPAAPATHTFEGLWWKQENNVSGFMALANLGAHPVNATVKVTDSNDAVLGSYQLTVSPNGTKMVDLTEIKLATASTGGIYVTHDGPEHSVAINAALSDEAVGYSAHLPLLPVPGAATPGAQPSSPNQTYASLGLMSGFADPMMAFPSGTVFTPYSVVRNISEQPASLTPSLWWMAGGAAHSWQSPTVTLAPHRTLNLDVPSLLLSAGLKNFNGSVNLTMETAAPAGALTLAGGSVDQKNTYVFEVPPRGVAESAAKNLSYWSTGNGDDTMISLWNPADEAQDFVFTVFYSGGHYLHPVHLEPRASLMFNASEITRNQIPDSEGNVIPAGIHEGSAEISGMQGEQEHILVAIDAGIYNVQKAICVNPCPTCHGWVEGFITLDPFFLPTTQTQQQHFTMQWDSGAQYDLTGGSNWNSSATSVATVGSAGMLNGVSPGSVNITAFSQNPQPIYIPNDCNTVCSTYMVSSSSTGTVKPIITSISPTFLNAGDNKKSLTINGSGFGSTPTVNLPSGVTLDSTNQTTAADTQIQLSAVNVAASTYIGVNSITVTANQKESDPAGFAIDGPDHMIVQSDQILTCSGCSTTVKRLVKYQIIKFSGSPVFVIPIGEALTTSGWNCSQGNPGSIPTLCADGEDTETDGTFSDGWSLSSDSYTPVGCGFNSIVDHWQWCSAPKIVGTLTGYCHTNAVSINGYVNPPNPMPIGKIINP